MDERGRSGLPLRHRIEGAGGQAHGDPGHEQAALEWPDLGVQVGHGVDDGAAFIAQGGAVQTALGDGLSEGDGAGYGVQDGPFQDVQLDAGGARRQRHVAVEGGDEFDGGQTRAGGEIGGGGHEQALVVAIPAGGSGRAARAQG